VTKDEKLAIAQELIGHRFSDQDLLHTALTHASVADSRLQSNERLEFLGDAVLGMVVCEELYRRFENWLEGDLTKVKSVVVSRRVCAEVADETGLSKLLILGNGIDSSSRLPTSVRAAVYEAIIGAVFLDGGIEVARNFILTTMGPHIDKRSASTNHGNFKSALQQFVQRNLSSTPQYEALDEQGPDHSKCFEISVVIDGKRYPSAWGPSKKEAEQEAARLALESLKMQEVDQEVDQDGE
jgi:ribonuclease-3